MGDFSVTRSDSSIIVANNEKFTIITDNDAIGPFDENEVAELIGILKTLRKMTNDQR